MRNPPPEGQPRETYACTECGHSYSRMEYLKRHQRKHENAKPFQCSICSKSFARSDVLLRHKRRCHEKVAAGQTPGVFSATSGDNEEGLIDENGEAKPAAKAKAPRKRASKKKDDGKEQQGANGKKRRQSSLSESSARPTARARLDDTDDQQIDPSLNDYGQYDLSTRSFLAYEAAQQQAQAHAVALAAAAGDGQAQDNGYSAYGALFASYPRMAGTPFSPSQSQQQQDRINPYASDLSFHLANMPSASNARADDSQENATASYDPAATLAAAATAIAAAQANGTDSSSARGHDRRPSNGSGGGGVISHNVEDAATLLSMAYGDRGGFDYASMALAPAAQTTTQQQPQEQHRGSTSSAVSNNEATTSSAVDASSGNEVGTSSSSTGHPKAWAPDSVKAWAPLTMNSGAGSGHNPFSPFDALLGADPSSREGAALFAAAAQFAAAFDDPNLFNAGADLPPDENDLFEYLPGSVPKLANFNPERPLMRIESTESMQRFGLELDVHDKYWIPSDRFGVCYTIPHWGMPPMKVLNRIARQTTSGLLSHVPLLHCPTFALKETQIGFAFSIVVVGGAKRSPLAPNSYSAPPGSVEEVIRDRMRDEADWLSGVSVLAPEKSPRTIIDVSDLPSEEERSFDSRKRLVVTEKKQMLHHLFAAASGNLITEFNIGILLGLFVFNVPALLSSSVDDRAAGYAENKSVIRVAQRMGIFDHTQLHARPYQALDAKTRSLDAAWRRWVKEEQLRRIAHLLFIFDTLSLIETATEPLVDPVDVLRIPNGAPDTLWKDAKTAEEWNTALDQYRSASPAACLMDTFQLFNTGVRSHFESVRFNHSDYGPLARLSIAFALIRGILAVARGEYRSSDGRYQISRMWGDESGPTLTYGETLQLFALALNRWRQGWDFDSLCGLATKKSKAVSPTANGRRSTSDSSSTEHVCTPPGEADIEEINTDEATTHFYEEALPYYWLAQALLSHLIKTDARPDSATHGPRERFAGVDLAQMLRSARVFTRTGEGLASPAS